MSTFFARRLLNVLGPVKYYMVDAFMYRCVNGIQTLKTIVNNQVKHALS